MHVDLAGSDATDVSVRAVDGNLEVVDIRTQAVISSQSLSGVDRLMLSSSDNSSQRININGLTSADLPGGLMLESGDGRADTLIVSGTQGNDTIFVNDASVDINGMRMGFTGVNRIVIQGTDADDTIEIADGLEIDVDVRDTAVDNRQQDRRRSRDRLARRDVNRRQATMMNGRTANRGPVNGDAQSGGMTRLLDQLFASGDLDQLLGMNTIQRRR